MLRSFGYSDSELREIKCGFAGDGQYIHLGVSKHLREELKYDNKNDGTIHDFAHVLNLCDQDARGKSKLMTWVINNMTKVIKLHTHGKLI